MSLIPLSTQQLSRGGYNPWNDTHTIPGKNGLIVIPTPMYNALGNIGNNLGEKIFSHITDVYRTPQEYQRLSKLYDAGNKSIVYKPAANSQHMNLENPAVDVSRTDVARWGPILRNNGFYNPVLGDYVHFAKSLPIGMK